MQKRDIEIVNKLGLHARASAKLTQLAGSHLQEMTRQAGNIFSAFTQRRQMNANDVQTME